MDDSLNTSDELTKSFGEYDCEDDEVLVYERGIKSTSTNPMTQMVNAVLLDRAKYNKSYTAACEYSVNLNSVPGAKLKLPLTKKQLKRESTQKYTYKYYVFCESCGLLVENGSLCEKCNKRTKKTRNNYFIQIPLLQQIENTLDKYLGIIVQNRQQKTNEMTDIHDSKIFKENQAKAENKILLPFTVCTDGVKIFNSSKTTLWPIQLLQNYLPPKIRYLMENILIVGLYCGAKKPQMSTTIMLPFAKEMDDLKRKGIFMWHSNKLIEFSPTVMFCTCDLPARADMQNCKTYSGYHGCPCCKQIGTSVKNPKTGRSYVRFLKLEQPAPLRTHHDAIQLGFDLLNGRESTNACGLKGLSCMVAFKDFDLSNGFVLDYMHGATIGIVPLLMDIWLGKKRLVYEHDETYQFKGMSTKQRLELNRRILGLKPVTRIRHKPRSILDRSFFTANEYRSLLFYYLRFALNGLIDKNLIKHFAMLSEALYTLSKSRITTNEIHQANGTLNKFADLFESYYGKIVRVVCSYNQRTFVTPLFRVSVQHWSFMGSFNVFF